MGCYPSAAWVRCKQAGGEKYFWSSTQTLMLTFSKRWFMAAATFVTRWTKTARHIFGQTFFESLKLVGFSDEKTMGRKKFTMPNYWQKSNIVYSEFHLLPSAFWLTSTFPSLPASVGKISLVSGGFLQKNSINADSISRSLASEIIL